MRTQKFKVVGRDTILRLRDPTIVVEDPGKLNIVNSSELNRIRDSSKLGAGDASMEQLQLQAAAEAERQERGRWRKSRILEAEKLRARSQTLTEIERQNAQIKNASLVRAKQALDEELDEVKRMNRMIAFAKVQTILDLQKEEKREIHRQHEEEDNRMNALMESERVKALSQMDDRDKLRQDEQRKRALIILDQIKERESRKLLAEEMRGKERLHILAQISEEQVRQEKLALDKREAQRVLYEEVLECNEAAMREKEAALHKQRAEDEKILDYQRQRDLKEREREESAALESQTREAELAKLRSRQERVKDKALEMDALRAKRAMERAEREARQKEYTEKERVNAINESLAEARRIQQAEKQLLSIEEARLDKQEFDSMNVVLTKLVETEKRRSDVRKQKQEEHALELKKQMEAKLEKKMQERKDYLEEGNMVREQLHAEAVRLNEKRKQKLALILKSGVPERHCIAFKKTVLA